MVASGNDFVVTDQVWTGDLARLTKELCDRKFGIGADGVLLIRKSNKASALMRIFNADGSEAEMCGNGARCATLFLGKKKGSLETKAGIINTELNGGNVKINLTDPKNIKLDIPIRVLNRNLKVNFIDTGVPHAVIFVEGLDEIHVNKIGREIRNHSKFAPRGTNVDFVEPLSKDLIAVRTYERGVEDETLACGTGSVASALIFSLKSNARGRIKVQTKSAEVLKIYFNRRDKKFNDVWLEGTAKIVYKGVYNV